MTDQPKPCPFCGSKMLSITKHFITHSNTDEVDTHYAIECLKCFAEGPDDLGESGAIEAWNDPKSFRMLKFGPYRSEKEARQVADRLNRDAAERAKCARIDRWAKAGAR